MRRAAITLAVTALVSLIAAACGGDDASTSTTAGDPSTTPSLPTSDRFAQTGVIDAVDPAAMAVTPSGDLLIGELRSGRILTVPAEQLAAEAPASSEFARLDVATEGQQGLLGLAVTADGTVLAALTRPDPGAPRQVVVRVVPGVEPEPVWIGPEAATDAIGGRLAMLPDGRVLLGLGDFLRAKAETFGPDEPYSKLLSLDPAGPPDQQPEVVSAGWNNPFAFTVAPDGSVWIADNAPGDRRERIGRGDDGGPVVDQDGERAPSGLAVLGGDAEGAGDDTGDEAGGGTGDGVDELALCGFVSGRLELIPVVDGTVQDASAVLAEPCRLGVLALPGGRLAVAVDDGVRILTPR